MSGISASALGAACVVPWEAGGVAGERALVEGVWRAPDLAARLRATWRAWVAAGGDVAMRAEEERRRRCGCEMRDWWQRSTRLVGRTCHRRLVQTWRSGCMVQLSA